jgi:hypothetical protein
MQGKIQGTMEVRFREILTWTMKGSGIGIGMGIGIGDYHDEMKLRIGPRISTGRSEQRENREKGRLVCSDICTPLATLTFSGVEWV